MNAVIARDLYSQFNLACSSDRGSIIAVFSFRQPNFA
jgi:hypothetical protein